MFKEKETEYGLIQFDNRIIADMVADAMDGYSGKIWLGDYGSRRFFRSNEENSCIDIEWEEGLKITIFVILKFGASISTITEAVLNNLKKQLLTALGDIDMELKIVVTGVQVKEQIAKRHIEVEL